MVETRPMYHVDIETVTGTEKPKESVKKRRTAQEIAEHNARIVELAIRTDNPALLFPEDEA